jgi:CRISPR-associated protein Cmr3
MTTFTIQPHDPAIARDGRPFAEGLRMKSLDWLYPSVVAGSLRTLLGKGADPTFPEKQVELLKEIRVEGPLPLANGELFFPAPKDLAIDAKTSRCIGARPRPVREGDRSNLPTGLDPVMLPEEIEEDFKPASPPAFWACGRMTAWLLNASGRGFAVPEGPEPPRRRDPASGYLDAPAHEERTHTAVAAETSTADESMLFQTVGLRFDEEVVLAARAEARNGFAAALATLYTIHPLGGERRLAQWRAAATDAWNCPDDVRTALGNLTAGAKVRMVLATPALFSGGWRPGWLDAKTLSGKPPGIPNCELKLKGASVGRWQAISGFSLEIGKTGPKEMRRLAPAGSVYFFELVGSGAADLADGWLKPVSDRPEDQGDGFGLALWGIWSE